MFLGRIGIILSFLILISILGNANEQNNKSLPRKSSPIRKNTNSATPNTSTIPQAERHIDSQNTSGSAPPLSTSSENSNDKVDVSDTIEEAPPVRGVKKRGSSVAKDVTTKESSLKDTSNGPASLFDDEKGFLAGLDYPELQVVPRASDRLLMEAQEERSSFISSYWPVQISSIALIVAGATAAGKYDQDEPNESQKKENQFASQMGVLVGAMWLGGTVYLNHTLSYSKALPDIKKISGKDKRSALLKERLAEEALERPAKIARAINNLSIWTNFILAGYIAAQSKQALPSYAGWAIGLSFLPLLIENRIVENWDKHQEYKRKIYAPITRFDFAIDPNSKQLTPVLGLQWRF